MNNPKYGPKTAAGGTCPACQKPFQVGDFTTLVELGPGDDPEAQKKMREGKPYNAVAVEIHWACAGGE